MRKNFRPWAVAGIMVAGLLQTSGVLLAETAPVVHVNAVVKDGTVRLEAEGTAPFEYTTYRPNSTLFVVDITGVTVDVAGAGDARVVDAGPVRSYRLIPYESGDKASTRLEVLLRTGVEPRIERENSTHLTLVIGNAGANLGAGATRSEARTVDARAELETAAPAESISDVHLAQAGQRTVVDVTGSGHLNYHVMRLSHPDRLVLDFTGAHLRTAEKSIPSNLDPVRVIRLAQFRPEVARVVIDLRQSAAFSVSADGNSVKVEFMPASDSQAPVQRTTGATTVKTKAHPQGSGVSDGLAHNEAPLALPASLTQPNAAMAMPTPGATTVFPVRAEIGATTPAAAAAASRAGAGVQAAQANAGGYTGEPISVNLKDVDLRDFFRLIHEISGLNVVLDPGVKGSLTIVLDDVPWDQALDIVLQNNDLDKQLAGNVLRIATKDTIKKEAEQERDLAKAQAEAADVVTTTRVLSYAKSDDMVTTLKKFLSARGDVLSDSRSNTVIIRDIPAVIPVMDNLIRQLDRRTQQVEIEARVVSASRTFASDIGSQLAFAAGRGNTTVGGNGSVGTSTISSIRRTATNGAGRQRDLRIPDAIGDRIERGGADQRPQLPVYVGQLRFGLYNLRSGAKGRREAALEAEDHHAEQPNGDYQTGNQAAGADHREQHRIGAVHRRGFATAGDPADHRRRQRIHGREGNQRPDRLRDPACARDPGNRYAIDRKPNSDQRWWNGDDGRDYRLQPADLDSAGADHRQPAAGRQPVQTHHRLGFFSGADVLPDPADHAWIAIRDGYVPGTEIEASVLPSAPNSPAANFRSRQERLRKFLFTQPVEALLVTHPPNIFYLSGFTGSSGVLLVEADRSTLFTDNRYTVQARDEVHGAGVEITGKAALVAAGVRLADLRGRVSAGFAPEQLTVRQRAIVAKAAGKRVRWKPVTGAVERLRGVKDRGEIAVMREAAILAGKVWESVLKLVKPGVSEIELAAEIEYGMRRGGASGPAFDTIVASGPRAALPHGRASAKPLEKNELVVFDLGAILRGYCSDITRTVYVGRAPRKVKDWYAAVLAAQEAARSVVTPGVTAGEVDAAARGVLERRRLEEIGLPTVPVTDWELKCTRRLGWAAETQSRLAAGNVITIEPGVYIEGTGGIRIEDDVWVRTGGAETLSQARRELLEL